MKKQLIAILLAGLVLLGLVPTGYAAEEAAEISPVYVESEFAPLKRVIVSQSELTDSILPLSEYYLPPENLEDPNVEVRDDTIYFHLDPVLYERRVQEREELVSILERYGVEVLRPRKLTDEELALATLPEGPTGIRSSLSAIM